MRFIVILNLLRDKIHTKLLSHKKGVIIGNSSIVYHKCGIDCYSISCKCGEVIIGKHCKIGRSPIKYHGSMPFHTRLLSDGAGKIVVGDNCRINGAYIHAEKSIVIGSNCVIASGVNIIDSNGHQVKSFDRTSGRDEPKEIVIGNNVWICMNATILKGSVIGDNSIITAGSVIQGIIPPNSIASSHSQLEIKKIEL